MFEYLRTLSFVLTNYVHVGMAALSISISETAHAPSEVVGRAIDIVPSTISGSIDAISMVGPRKWLADHSSSSHLSFTYSFYLTRIVIHTR